MRELPGDRATILRVVGLLVAQLSPPEVNLHANLLRNEGAAAIATVLQDSPAARVTSLDLSHNLIGTEGARALAALCAASPTLLHLDLHYNRLKDAGAVAIASALRESATSQLANHPLTSPERPRSPKLWPRH